MSESAGAILKNKEDEFFHLIGNTLQPAYSYLSLYRTRSSQEYLDGLRESREEFHKRLDRLELDGHLPSERICNTKLAELRAYAELDWSENGYLEKLMGVYNGLKSEKINIRIIPD